MSCCRMLAVLAVMAGAASAADEAPALADLFTAGEGPYHTYRIPATVITSRGTVLVFCEGRVRGRSDAGDIDLILIRSTDGGRTWSKPAVVWNDGPNTCGNPAPVVDRKTGAVMLLMTWNRGDDHESDIMTGKSRDTRRVFVTRSVDDGLSWQKPKDITDSVKRPDWRWYATGPVHGIQLTRGPHAGRLVIPANHSTPAEKRSADTYRSHVIFSDDHGATWRLGGVHEKRTNESTVVELADGAILQNMRSYHGRKQRAVSISRDGGATWGPLRHDPALVEPVCQGSLLRWTWPADGEPGRILFANPASDQRKNMTVRMSVDGARTWPRQCRVYPGSSAYSDMVRLGDGRVGLVFERDGYSKISWATLDPDDFSAESN